MSSASPTLSTPKELSKTDFNHFVDSIDKAEVFAERELYVMYQKIGTRIRVLAYGDLDVCAERVYKLLRSKPSLLKDVVSKKAIHFSPTRFCFL
jgi:hypothetical protein